MLSSGKKGQSIKPSKNAGNSVFMSCGNNVLFHLYIGLCVSPAPTWNYFIVAGAIFLYGSVYFRLVPTPNKTYQYARCNVSEEAS